MGHWCLAYPAENLLAIMYFFLASKDSYRRANLVDRLPPNLVLRPTMEKFTFLVGLEGLG